MRAFLAALIVCLGFYAVPAQSREIGGPYDMYATDAPAHAARHAARHRVAAVRHHLKVDHVEPREAKAAPIDDLTAIADAMAHSIEAAAQKAVGCGHALRGNLVDCKTGASTSVSSAMLPHAQCLLAKLDAAGYRVEDIGGFGARPHNPSAHPTGNALDVNQCGFGCVTRRLPDGYVQMAEACGLYSGSHFGDKGHFEMPRKYGYVFPSGVRYARHYARRYASHRRRHYAGA